MSDFEKRTREVLEESTARLDGRTLSRLTQARHAALGRLERPARPRWHLFVPAGAAAAVALMVVMWSGRQASDPVPLVQVESPMEDVELFLTDTEAPDFVDDGEDLEFYEWAAGELES